MRTMKTAKTTALAVLITGATASASPDTSMVDRLIQSYKQLETVTCRVRRTTELPEGKVTHLSRVSWKRGDRIHVENFAPMNRRYVADGERMYYYIEGDPKGFSRPIEDLEESWKISLRKVPGSPMDHLVRLREADEEALEPTRDYPHRFGYQAGPLYAVVSLDARRRPRQIEFYKTADREERTGRHRYDDFEEVAPGVWIPMSHEGTVTNAGRETRESTRFDNYRANEPIPDRLFVAEPFFEGVEFADSFEDIYE